MAEKSGTEATRSSNLFGTFLERLYGRADRIAWTNLVDDTRAMWEPYGYRVYVNSNEQKVVITAEGNQ